MESYIRFCNHASVLISNGSSGLLTDPWYFGSIFNFGWKLLYENTDSDIQHIINETTHIWISHEHPDHFSVPFFNKYNEIIKKRGIKILFQNTNDKRLINFKLKSFEVIEIKENENYHIDYKFSAKIIKDGFYDSALIILLDNLVICNLNDCQINTHRTLNKLHKSIGNVDILLSQFSYAAWKGGADNLLWRQSAAFEKLSSLKLQANLLNAKLVIPFASFTWFANLENFYLNDFSNKPNKVLDYFKTSAINLNVKFFQPMESMPLHMSIYSNSDALNFWNEKYSNVTIKNCLNYETSIKFDDLLILFNKYCIRIKEKNSKLLILLLSLFPYFYFFKKVYIYIYDLELTLCCDIVNNSIAISKKNWDIEMHSESFKYLLTNMYGLDALTINGCFKINGWLSFKKFINSFSLDNLNCLGIYLNIRIIFNIKILKYFILKMIHAKSNIT